MIELGKPDKKLYNGKYNWYGEIHNLWTRAENEIMAHRQFVIRLAKVLNTSRSRVSNYFYGEDDRFGISHHETE